jgi:UDP-N-acetylglucosamine transferase subunit ALG13
VIPASHQQQIAEKLDEVVSINTDATNRSLQVALLIERREIVTANGRSGHHP